MFPAAVQEILQGLVRAHGATVRGDMASQWTPYHTDAGSQQMVELQRSTVEQHTSLSMLHAHVVEVEVVTLDEGRSRNFLDDLCALSPAWCSGTCPLSQPLMMCCTRCRGSMHVVYQLNLPTCPRH